MTTSDKDLTDLEFARARLPLRFSKAYYDLIYLNVSGSRESVEEEPRWFFGASCEWRLMVDGEVLIDMFDSEDITEPREQVVLDFLLDREIVGVTADDQMHDPTFHITGGIDLIIRADDGYYMDPWLMGFPQPVLVGQMPPDSKYGIRYADQAAAEEK